MTDETPRAGDLCPECGTPLEIAQISEDADPQTGATLMLQCTNGHRRTVHRHDTADDVLPGDPT